MNLAAVARRLVPVAAVAAFVAVGVVVDQDRPTPAQAQFGDLQAPAMPVAPSGGLLTASWFCPGVPASSATGSGVVTVLNPDDPELDGTITFTPSEGDRVTQPLRVAGRTRVDLKVTDAVQAPVVSILVELYGAGGVVEQTATTKAGSSTSACATSAAPAWYFADGATTVDASSSLVLYNPFPDEATVDVSFATQEGQRTPTALKNFLVPAQSVRVIDVDQAVLREPQVATSVVARVGRVVAGRLQSYNATRKGFVAGLGTPAPSAQWWFAEGRKGQGVAERVVVYNPGDQEADVSLTLYPADPTAPGIPPVDVTVAPGAAEVVNLSAETSVPDGEHSILVASPDVPVVVERALDLLGTRTAATDVFGAPLVAGRWYTVTGAPAAGASTVVVANVTNQQGTVSIKGVGAAGETALPGGDSVSMAPGAVLRFDLTAAQAANLPVVVEGDTSLVVERLVTPGPETPGASLWMGVPGG